MGYLKPLIDPSELLEYRGVYIRPSGTELRLLVPGEAGSLLLELLAEVQDPGPEERTRVVDRYWGDIYQKAQKYEYATCDGVPWEIHGILDPAVREEAIAAYRTNRFGHA